MEEDNQYLVKIISVGWIVLNKKNIERIATKRIEILIDNALNEINSDEVLSQTYAKLALKIGMRVRVRMPYSIRQLFCRKCKQFIVPGVNSRIRIGRTRVKCIRITCMKCNHVYRKIIVNWWNINKSGLLRSNNFWYYFKSFLYYLGECLEEWFALLRS